MVRIQALLLQRASGLAGIFGLAAPDVTAARQNARVAFEVCLPGEPTALECGVPLDRTALGVSRLLEGRGPAIGDAACSSSCCFFARSSCERGLASQDATSGCLVLLPHAHSVRVQEGLLARRGRSEQAPPVRERKRPTLAAPLSQFKHIVQSSVSVYRGTSLIRNYLPP